MHAFGRQSDRQTDGQTDRIIPRPRLRSMLRGKKFKTLKCEKRDKHKNMFYMYV